MDYAVRVPSAKEKAPKQSPRGCPYRQRRCRAMNYEMSGDSASEMEAEIESLETQLATKDQQVDNSTTY